MANLVKKVPAGELRCCTIRQSTWRLCNGACCKVGARCTLDPKHLHAWHRQTWVAATRVLQRAARAALFRRRLRRGPARRAALAAGVVRLQALWRGRAARARRAAMAGAATTLAAVVRGWLARRRVWAQRVLPALLAAGADAKCRLQAARLGRPQP